MMDEESKNKDIDINWALVLMFLIPLFGGSGQMSQLEKDVAELKGKMEILERMI